MVVYCEADDVRQLLQRRKPFSDTSSPTKDYVDSLIEMREDDINSQTGHSWKEEQIVQRYIQHYTSEQRFYVFDLGNRKIKSLDTAQGDKIEVNINNQWVDYVTDKTFGKQNDYWINYEMGLLYIRRYTSNEDDVRVTFRYGEPDVTGNIRKLTMMWVAADILEMYEQSMTLPEDGSVDRIPLQTKLENLRKRANVILQDVSEWRTMY